MEADLLETIGGWPPLLFTTSIDLKEGRQLQA
jgi:hypothetical protein